MFVLNNITEEGMGGGVNFLIKLETLSQGIQRWPDLNPQVASE
jgi:hypothetical protein